MQSQGELHTIPDKIRLGNETFIMNMQMLPVRRAGAALLAAFLFGSATVQPCLAFGHKQVVAQKTDTFSRFQMMVVNLNRTKGSTGFTIVQSSRQIKQMEKELDKALSQLEQVEKTYAKSRKRPDDRYFDSTEEKLKHARATAQQLESQLSDAYYDLKGAIKQTLIME